MPGATIPVKYTADGENLSPPLSFDGIPAGTASLALVCEDPDAPLFTFIHWVVYDIPGGATGLPEGVPPDSTLPNGSHQGMNGWKKFGYGGPSPPGHKPHRYVFRLYALREGPISEPGRSAKELRRALEGRVLESAEYVGTYGRP